MKNKPCDIILPSVAVSLLILLACNNQSAVVKPDESSDDTINKQHVNLLINTVLRPEISNEAGLINKMCETEPLPKGIGASTLGCSICINMAYVEGGSFSMGCTQEQRKFCYEDEKPVHVVSLKSYYIGKYEINGNQWQSIMGGLPKEHEGFDACPINNVSWYEIQDFIEKLNQKTGKKYRLPTEAEWEFAARGGKKSRNYIYSGSDSIDKVAIYSLVNPNPGLQATTDTNELGLGNMSGHLWEWCSDWFDMNYYNISPINNPLGPDTGEYKVVRGGSWNNVKEDCRVSNRSSLRPDSRLPFVGFRLVMDIK